MTIDEGGLPYELDDDPSRIDADAVWAFLSTDAYWHRWRARSDVDAQLASAWRVVGAYAASGAQVGFARAVSDGVALAYLADVYVLAEHRGHGLGTALVARMIDDGPGARFRWLLHTADAHPLYARFGFAPPDASCLERRADTGPAPDAWQADVAAVWQAAGELTEDEVVARIEALVAARPGTAQAHYELASAYDFVGREAEAEPLYRSALAAGLDDERRAGAVIQLASTVRNLGRAEETVALLRDPLPARFADAQAAFTALALLDAGRDREAATTALRALTGRLPVYGRAVGFYLGELEGGDIVDGPTSDS